RNPGGSALTLPYCNCVSVQVRGKAQVRAGIIVIADTVPPNYLLRIGAVEVLKPLYTHVLIPRTVADELKKEKAPAAVQTWIAHPPEWLEVRPDPASDFTLQLLDPGEAAALLLAESVD